jgi:hypothetical protein
MEDGGIRRRISGAESQQPVVDQLTTDVQQEGGYKHVAAPPSAYSVVPRSLQG